MGDIHSDRLKRYAFNGCDHPPEHVHPFHSGYVCELCRKNFTNSVWLMLEDAHTITRLTRERDDLRVDAEMLSDSLDSMREGRDEAVAGLAWVTSDWTPVEDATCPVCGGMVKWSCGTGKYPHGRADCQDGRRVSRRWPGDGEPCAWHGAPTIRVGGGVRVKLTDDPAEIAELRALADAYIDIVNRTARALGIPEVDEDGATPSLHDVPERVGRLVASDAEFRKWVGTGRDGCPPYSSDVAWQLQRLDESFKALHDGAEVVRRERNKLLGDIEMLGYMLGMGPDDDTSPEAVLRFAERLNRGEEPTDDDATQGPPGWGGGEVSDGE